MIQFPALDQAWQEITKQSFRNELIKSGDAVEVTTPNGQTP